MSFSELQSVFSIHQRTIAAHLVPVSRLTSEAGDSCPNIANEEMKAKRLSNLLKVSTSKMGTGGGLGRLHTGAALVRI